MNQRMFHRICACLLLIVTTALALPALAAEKESEHFGDTSGTPFTVTCQQGAVVGFAYTWDTYNLSSISAKCQSLNEKGLPTGPVTSTTPKGVSVKFTGQISCSSGYLNRILVGLTNAQTVQYIETQCFDVTRGPSQTAPRATSYNGIRGKDSDAISGSYETYAYAIVGTYTKSGSTPGINSIGLKCRTLDAANGDDNGNDNGNGNDIGNDNGNGDQAVAPNGATIYKQPNGDDSDANVAGYVDAGGSVTVVNCSDNFCRGSAPEAGYIWHEDIGR